MRYGKICAVNYEMNHVQCTNVVSLPGPTSCFFHILVITAIGCLHLMWCQHTKASDAVMMMLTCTYQSFRLHRWGTFVCLALWLPSPPAAILGRAVVK